MATSEGSGIRTATCLVISVSMWPGDTRETETPVPASCRRSASSRAVAAPMPELAPVTIATSPASAGIVRLAAYRI